MAGARLGFGVGCKSLMADLNMIKYSTNPYNVNAMTMAAGLGVLEDEEYTKANCKTVAINREYTAKELKKTATGDSRWLKKYYETSAEGLEVACAVK
jgi:histidinol-phosphate aminotransferase